MRFKASPVKSLHHDPAELFRGDLTGLPAPEIHRQLASQRDQGPFLLPGGGLGIKQDMLPPLDGFTLRLIKHHAPGQFDQSPADAGIAGLGDGEITMALAGTADAAAQSGVTADLFAVLEAGPVAEFGDEHAQREWTQTFGPDFRGQGLDLFGQGVELFLDGGNEFAPDLQPGPQPFREGERLGPPFTPQTQALRQTKTAALGSQALPFAPKLLALAGERPPLFFGFGGDADDAHGPEVAPEVAIQIQGQFAGIGLVGHHPFMLGIEFVRMHNIDGDPQRAELPVEVKAAGSGLINDDDLVRQSTLFFHEGEEAGRREPLGGLRRLPITHPHHAELLDVPVHAEFELADTGLRFRVERRIRFHRHV